MAIPPIEPVSTLAGLDYQVVIPRCTNGVSAIIRGAFLFVHMRYGMAPRSLYCEKVGS